MKNRVQERRDEAKARQEASDALSPEQRLSALDEKLGKGQGAVKERAKLLAAIEKIKQEKAAKKEKAEKPVKEKGKRG